jgi:hypothetical protein
LSGEISTDGDARPAAYAPVVTKQFEKIVGGIDRAIIARTYADHK